MDAVAPTQKLNRIICRSKARPTCGCSIRVMRNESLLYAPVTTPRECLFLQWFVELLIRLSWLANNSDCGIVSSYHALSRCLSIERAAVCPLLRRSIGERSIERAAADHLCSPAAPIGSARSSRREKLFAEVRTNGCHRTARCDGKNTGQSLAPNWLRRLGCQVERYGNAPSRRPVANKVLI